MKKNNLHAKSLFTALVLGVASIGLATAGTIAFFQNNATVLATVTSAIIDVKVKAVATSFTKTPTTSTATMTIHSDGSVLLSNVAPNDTLTFELAITNNSTIPAYYHITHTCDLAGMTVTTGADSDTLLSAKTNPSNVTVTVKYSGTETETKNATITFGVETVQANLRKEAADGTAFISAMNSGAKKVVLTQDVTAAFSTTASTYNGEHDAIQVRKEQILDLGGKTLTVTNTDNFITFIVTRKGGSLTIRNGKIIYSRLDASTSTKGTTYCALSAIEGSTLTLDNVTYTATDATCFYFDGGSHVVIKNNSTVETTNGDYVFATKTNENTSVIDIEGSTLKVDSTDKNIGVGLQLFGGSTVNMKDSKLYFKRSAITARGANIHLSGTNHLYKTGNATNTDSKNGTFGDDYAVPESYLYVGNDTNTKYPYDSSLTLDGTVNFDTSVVPGTAITDNTPIVLAANDSNNMTFTPNGHYSGVVSVFDFRTGTTADSNFKIQGNDIATATTKRKHDGNLKVTIGSDNSVTWSGAD